MERLGIVAKGRKDIAEAHTTYPVAQGRVRQSGRQAPSLATVFLSQLGSGRSLPPNGCALLPAA